jgi:DNA-binding MarR family transcriptional regulator
MNDIGLVELFWNVHRRIVKRLAPIARQEGMSMSELIVLWKAHQCGSRRVTALSEDLGLPPSTLTGMMDRLVRAGWLDRARDPEDRRAVVMKSTPRLDELVKSLKRAGNRALERALRTLPSETLARLEHDLASVLECLEQEEEVQ